ncbi:transcriptional regulator [Streptomyces sp. NBC_00536]|uniref:transcriptional regulator n=1 Tax=Streptomyces sp. NBC_00536 TaxID=2975769 RepID=UPI002E823057|nr:transcriptional regulator [Streptomyces sp. NBC_00536]WUC83459.1 transcriptional regulator [Streptomyces sp. NBC_00536]
MAQPAARPNEALAHWVRISGASYSRIAAEVGRVAARHGRHDIQPDSSRVSRWINRGERPRHPAPEFLAEAMSSLCRGRTLTPADLGLASAGPPPWGGDGWSARTVVAAILDTTRSDAVTDDRTPSRARPLSGAALVKAVQPWLHLHDLEPLPAPERPGPRLGRSDVARIEATTEAFRELDNAHGGGLSRLAVVGQLQHVTHLTRTGTYTEETGRALFVAVAELASVAGWMTHDAGAHADAQNYLLLGLQAAKQAGRDGAGIGGHLMNCLARQANHLGRTDDALDLVQAAQYGTRKLRSGRLRALLCSLEARSHAALGHIDEMTRANGAAEQALADEDTATTPGWAAWFDLAEFRVTAGVCEFEAAEYAPDRVGNAITLIERGTAERPAERVRSRAFDQIALARAHVRADEPEAADTATAAALNLMGTITSTRVSDRLRELDTELGTAPGGTVTADSRARIRAALQPL